MVDRGMGEKRENGKINLNLLGELRVVKRTHLDLFGEEWLCSAVRP